MNTWQLFDIGYASSSLSPVGRTGWFSSDLTRDAFKIGYFYNVVFVSQM